MDRYSEAKSPESEPCRESQVLVALSRLGDAVSEINAIVEQVEGRLSAVLVPESTANKQGSVPQPVVCALAGLITERAAGIETAITHLQGMLKRLEL